MKALLSSPFYSLLKFYLFPVLQNTSISNLELSLSWTVSLSTFHLLSCSMLTIWKEYLLGKNLRNYNNIYMEVSFWGMGPDTRKQLNNNVVFVNLFLLPSLKLCCVEVQRYWKSSHRATGIWNETILWKTLYLCSLAFDIRLDYSQKDPDLSEICYY